MATPSLLRVWVQVAGASTGGITGLTCAPTICQHFPMQPAHGNIVLPKPAAQRWSNVRSVAALDKGQAITDTLLKGGNEPYWRSVRSATATCARLCPLSGLRGLIHRTLIQRPGTPSENGHGPAGPSLTGLISVSLGLSMSFLIWQGAAVTLVRRPGAGLFILS